MVYRHLLTTPKQSKDTLRKETGEQGKAEEDRKEQEERGEDMAGQGNAVGKKIRSMEEETERQRTDRREK